jgi:hypothetical protein
MSNPIKAIIVLKEESGGGGDPGAVWAMFLIIAHIIVGNMLDLGFFVIFVPCALILFAYLWGKLGCLVIAGLVVYGGIVGIWGWGKLQEKHKDSNAPKSERLGSVEKTTPSKDLNSEVSTEDKSKDINIQNRTKSEPNKSPANDLIELSSIKYPASFLTTSDSKFLAADGKETFIPANTRITILKRTPTGMLTLEANGKTYLGYESRLNGKLKK